MATVNTKVTISTIKKWKWQRSLANFYYTKCKKSRNSYKTSHRCQNAV